MAGPQVLTVNVVHEVFRGPSRYTAIDKRPVPAAVEVAELGLAGDQQCDQRHHGGPDKAVYAYAREDAEWWADRLGREIPPGTFGENLTTLGLDVSGAVIGEQWQLGDDLLVEVRLPRTPCSNLSARMGLRGWHLEFAAAGRVGAYLKVLRPGPVAAGVPIEVRSRPDHGVTISDLAVGPTAAQAARLLAADHPLAEELHDLAVRRSRRRADTQGEAGAT